MNGRATHTGIRLGLLSVLIAVCSVVRGQCTTTISTFPYTEGFETDDVFVSGGTNSDWAWGAPAHPTLYGAANGLNAWCVGGLTGSFYTNGQQSWLETPCFDLSVLDQPWLSFNIWWETEPGYDGIGLQYSPNGGTTWLNVGSVNDPADCHTLSWFNSSNITALNLASPRQGWSGTSISGGCASGLGSNGYVTAAHCLAGLQTGQAVKFRFIFGAGTICNTFDGVAIDDFSIGEAPPLNPAFNYTCAGNTITFNATGAPGCLQNGTWNFGDPGSGSANTGNGAVANHTYPGPGEYVVDFTMTSSCSDPVTVQRTIVIADLDLDVMDVGCTPNSGAVSATVIGGNGGYSYSWSPGGASTASISGIGAGTYTVLVQAPDMCPLQRTATVVNDAGNITATETHEDVTCNGSADGSAVVVATGGSGNFTYVWTPGGSTTAAVNGLGPGTYSCAIEDDNDCATEIEVVITEPAPVVVIALPDPTICAGASTTLSASATGGTAGYVYEWSPEGPTVTPEGTTTYTVQATDANGCVSTPDEVVVTVTASFQPAFTWDVDEGCAPLCVVFTDVSPVSGVRSWNFGDGSIGGDGSSPEHCFTSGGDFDITLSITTTDGCSGSLTLEEIIHVYPRANAAFSVSPEVALIDDPVFDLLSLGSGIATWLWTFGDEPGSTNDEPAPVFAFPEVGCYTVGLEVTTFDGCMDQAERIVCVEDAFALYAPNCFTPNADSFNDVFMVNSTVADPKEFLLTIYDRWGSVIHSTIDPRGGWNGDGIDTGVYIWQVSLRDREGRIQRRQGHVTLLR